jgi:hypothetical protein
MIRRLRQKISNLLLSLALKVLPKNSKEQLLLAITLKKHYKLSEDLKKSIPKD